MVISGGCERADVRGPAGANATTAVATPAYLVDGAVVYTVVLVVAASKVAAACYHHAWVYADWVIFGWNRQ